MRVRRRALLTFGLVVLVLQAALVVTTWIPAPSNGGDNAAYVGLAHALLSGQGYRDVYDPAGLPHTKYPPVLPLILAAWIAAGARTWTALKSVPALFTVLWVSVAYLWAAGRRTPRFGLAVAGLTGLSGAVLWSSHWILSEPPFLLFTFLALQAVERASRPAAVESGEGGPIAAGSGRGPGPDGAVDPSDAGAGIDTAGAARLGVAVVAAVLAYFTRSAGVPLLVAFAAWMALERRWKSLVGFAIVAGTPSAVWWLRARSVAGPGYVGEFWMADPYDPSAGTVGVTGLMGRVVDNLGAYTLQHVPVGLVGEGVGGFAPLLGLLLAGLALAGWARRLRRPHVAEIFFPLYTGLILLWPQVWAGDRFALPLLPLLLFYGGEGLLWLVGMASRRAAPVAGVLAVVLVGAPALTAWSGSVSRARACAAAVRTGGAFACYGPRWTEFVDAARWSGRNLPPGSAVLTRKPRIFYVMGGVPSRTYPFTDDPEAFLREARAAGARYVLLDYLGPQGPTWVGGVLRRRPETFCVVRSFGEAGGGQTQLLGLVPEGSGLGGAVRTGEDGRRRIAVPGCPPELMPSAASPVPLAAGLEIPLLAGSGQPSSPSSEPVP